jgi:glycosyltransferase involved in cell wall biosynthesis
VTTPFLSVVTPTHDCLPWLPRALEGALGVAAPIEVVVVDDGSSDGTPAYLAAAALRDPRIRVVRQAAAQGVSAARNAGIAAARGQFIGFLDADDVWLPQKLVARLAWHAAHPEATMSFSEYETLRPDGTRKPRLLGYMPRFKAAVAGLGGVAELPGAAGLIYGENPVCTSSVIAARAALLAVGGFDAALRQAEDWDLWVRLALYGPVGYSTAVEVLHMDRPGSLSRQARARCAAVVQVARRHRMAVLARHPVAVACGAARVAEARAECAEAEGDSLGQVIGQMGALLLWPSRRRLREAARAVARAAHLMPRPVPG